MSADQFRLSAQQYADSIRPVIVIRVLAAGGDWYRLELKVTVP